MKQKETHIFKGRYFFHFHTYLTDGSLSLTDYFQFASLHRFERLIALEHIRRTPTYDVDAYANELRSLSTLFNIEAVLGFETKLMPDGKLDIDHQHLAMARVIGIAEHGFPDDPYLLYNAFTSFFKNYEEMFHDKIWIWVHPGSSLKKNRSYFLEDNFPFKSILKDCLAHGILIEHNRRYSLLSRECHVLVPTTHLIKGCDAHHPKDLPLSLHFYDNDIERAKRVIVENLVY